MKHDLPTSDIAARRSSRFITIFSMLGIVVIIAVVLLTSERNGPGSEQALVEAYPTAASSAATPIAIATMDPTTAASVALEVAAAAADRASNATSLPVANAPAGASVPTATGAPVVPSAAPVAAAPAPSECVATQTMPGGDNNYRPNAPQVESLGTGLIVSGTVREAGTCEPVRNARIQIWLNTARGGEGDPSNRGSVLTDANGHYQLETSPVVPQFGQPHVHIAYDDGQYQTLFLRSVMESKDVPTFTVDFVLEPSDDG